jgi:hypothetical protein
MGSASDVGAISELLVDGFFRVLNPTTRTSWGAGESLLRLCNGNSHCGENSLRRQKLFPLIWPCVNSPAWKAAQNRRDNSSVQKECLSSIWSLQIVSGSHASTSKKNQAHALLEQFDILAQRRQVITFLPTKPLNAFSLPGKVSLGHALITETNMMHLILFEIQNMMSSQHHNVTPAKNGSKQKLVPVLADTDASRAITPCPAG